MAPFEKSDVALRKESVDRNVYCKVYKLFGMLSLSARRAWIEIHCVEEVSGDTWVALRKESVDRNVLMSSYTIGPPVALRKESVDRNVVGDVMGKGLAGRSPQGERG